MNRDQVLADPLAASTTLAALPGVTVIRTLIYGAGVEFSLEFAPPRELEVAGYGVERARVLVRRAGDPEAFPVGGPRRRWKHRNWGPGGSGLPFRMTGSLCLFYNGDDRALRWEWEDGLADYVVRAHRHLYLEEHWRREGFWAYEDAPHTLPPPGGRHPVRTIEMKEVRDRWTASMAG